MLTFIEHYYMPGTLQTFSYLTFTTAKRGYFNVWFANEPLRGYMTCPDHTTSKWLNWDLVPLTGIRFQHLKIPSLF